LDYGYKKQVTKFPAIYRKTYQYSPSQSVQKMVYHADRQTFSQFH